MVTVRWIVRVAVVSGLVGAGMLSAMAHEHPQGGKIGSAEFERVKTLAGKWQGTSQEGKGAPQPVSVEYQVTSGGSAVVETLFVGTPNEMVSVYHDRNGKLMMTHYCMVGNRPQLALTHADAHRLTLSLGKGSGIDVAHELHMHALSLEWTDPDHLTQVWTAYEHGKAQPPTTITLSRVH